MLVRGAQWAEEREQFCFLSSSPVVSMRNRCSLLDTVSHPPALPISPTVCSHTYIVSGEMQALTRDVRLLSPDFYCPFPWLVSCSWVNTWFNQVLLPPLSVCRSVLTLWAVCRRVGKVSLIKDLLYVLLGVRITRTYSTTIFSNNYHFDNELTRPYFMKWPLKQIRYIQKIIEGFWATTPLDSLDLFSTPS